MQKDIYQKQDDLDNEKKKTTELLMEYTKQQSKLKQQKLIIENLRAD